MFIFIDITQLTKELKRLYDVCIKCRHNRELILIKTYRCFRIFFIPVWHWHEKYYIVDPGCGATYQISEEDAILVKYEKKSINACQVIEAHQTTLMCLGCHKQLDQDYDFCPYCGQKRK
ncbi:zinc ribbon domain-containing protein [Cellulosilyticum sp. I15G10I2]|uniref:zinc ribbon domain-containing protein n=1 Tax=Cellulosilyticum sp. I15G10I2 TaxID=1892843 RepID=UPI00085CD950|nr:zinc ribbon domain-containing protein [Cellulosilyticum sp. I15G10I2]